MRSQKMTVSRPPLLLLLLLCVVGHFRAAFALQDVTADLFGSENHGTVAAFGDFNSDKQTDIFIIRDQPGLRLELNKTFVDQPLIMDFDGDMIPDIFGVIKDGSTEVCYLKNRIIDWRVALSPPINMRIPHSNAFIDVNMDFTADGDGHQDHLLPVCLDDACQSSAIYLAGQVYKGWNTVLSDFQQRDTKWGFVPGVPGRPMTLHLGDYNMDGFPDALVILRNGSNGAQQAFLLENVPCTNASCQAVGRTFLVHWDQSELASVHQAAVATFFDIYEDR
ncbi:hypothetical protein CRUP_022502 [Coryphaenoides rupestris]|nr:hypothetical protein CRUP_022502 [Coryphaenoides rupestris]